jgi:tetratricopeptide (TPR) repeat protein
VRFWLHHSSGQTRPVKRLWVMLCPIVGFAVMCLSLPVLAKEEQEISALVDIDIHEAHARTLFRKKNFQAAVLALQGKSLTLDGQWITAESLFRLGNYNDAKVHYEQIVTDAKDTIQKRKAAIRLFDVDILLGNVQSSVARYTQFQKDFGQPSGRMKYALGKMLYDAQHFDRASTILRGIKKGSEFYARARYIVATIGLEGRDFNASVKLFNQIEALVPVSTEDYAVRQMAILAQGRIFADNGREDLAEKAYARVTLENPFGEIALSELIKAMLNRAFEAKYAEGRFNKVGAFRRGLVEKAAIESAQKAVERFRKTHEISWQNPDLLTQIASLLVLARRYDDARLLLAELTDHFRPIHALLLAETKQEALWPCFALDFERDGSPLPTLLKGVPNSMVKGLGEIQEIMALRDRIELSHKKLHELLEAASLAGVSNIDFLNQASLTQTALEASYVSMALEEQAKIGVKVASLINQSLAEAEFLRARLVQQQMANLEKQVGVVQQFQNDKIELFEHKLNEIDEGSVP